MKTKKTLTELMKGMFEPHEIGLDARIKKEEARGEGLYAAIQEIYSFMKAHRDEFKTLLDSRPSGFEEVRRDGTRTVDYTGRFVKFCPYGFLGTDSIAVGVNTTSGEPMLYQIEFCNRYPLNEDDLILCDAFPRDPLVTRHRYHSTAVNLAGLTRERLEQGFKKLCDRYKI